MGGSKNRTPIIERVEPLRLALLQMNVDDQDVSENLRTISALASELDGENVDLVVLPELCDFGYDLASIRRRAGSADSPALGAMRSVAEALDCFVAGGIVEPDGGRLFDTLAVIDPEGVVVSRYRKIQLYGPAGESDVFEPGTSLETVDVRGWTIGLAVCNDLRYPEIARGLTEKGIDALILAAAWPFPRVRHFTTLVEARAIENQVFVVAANRVGRLGETLFCGCSRVVDPHGDVVASASEDREALLRASLDPAVLHWVRLRPGWRERRMNFLKTP